MTDTLPVSDRALTLSDLICDGGMSNVQIRDAIATFEREITQSTAHRMSVLEAALRHARTFIENRFSDLSPEKLATVAHIERALKGAADVAE